MATKLPLPKLDASHLGAHRLFVHTDNALFDACGVRIAFTSRQGGVSTGSFASLNCGNHVGDDTEAVKQNRAIVLDALGKGDELSLIVPSQVHGTTIVEVDDRSSVPARAACAAEGADSIIVRTTKVAALLNFADCLPLILVSASGEFAVAHAGWRGALGRIASKSAQALASSQFDLKEMNAYVGPFIHVECFEVSEEIASDFSQEFGSHVLGDHRHVDLFQVVKTDLIEAGLDPARIVEAHVCTQCHPDEYFSYRAQQGDCGRHAAAAVRL